MELYKVIKNQGPADALFWKFPAEDFYTRSQLIVSESEEALFVRDGVILQTFNGGRFSLSTANFPFLNSIQKMFSGGISAFNCKVYYVNKEHKLEILWGTDSPIPVIDPYHDISMTLIGHGAYTVRVANSKLFVLKFIGSNQNEFSVNSLTEQFRSIFMQEIKTCIATTVQDAKQEIVRSLANLGKFAERLTPKFTEILAEYGIELVRFNVAGLEIPESDPNWSEFQRRRTETGATRQSMRMLGEMWEVDQNKQIQMALAKNEGSGSVAGLGMALGLGVHAADVMGGMSPIFGQRTRVMPPPLPGTPTLEQNLGNFIRCQQCNAQIPSNSKFCCDCGTKITKSSRFCIKCGNEIPVNARFCSNCGTPQGGQNE